MEGKNNSLLEKEPWLTQILEKGELELPVQNEQLEETPVEPPEDLSPPSEEPVQAEEITSEVEQPQVVNKEPVKIKVTDYLKEHKDKVREYFEVSSIDTASLTPEQLVRKKLEKDNPDFSSSEIDAELKDKYGIGLDLKKKSFDVDIHTEAEIKEIQEFNENIESQILRGQRKLKQDSKEALTYLESLKDSIELPELTFENPEPTTEVKSIEDYTKEIEQQQTKYKEEIWLPTIDKAISEVESVQYTIGVEVTEGNKVVSDSDYKLSPTEKTQLKEYLTDYIGHPSDSKYYDKDSDKWDMNKFVADKAKEMFATSIIDFKVKELTTKFKKEFIKNELNNYDDTPRKVSTGGQEDKSFEDFLFNRKPKTREL